MPTSRNEIVSLAHNFYNSLAPDGPSSPEQLVSEDWVQIPLSEHSSPGREGYSELQRFVASTFSEIEVTVDDVLVDGDRVAVRSSLRGAHTGNPVAGFAPSGQRVELRACDIHRVADGIIVQSWHLEDFAGLMGQLAAASKDPA